MILYLSSKRIQMSFNKEEFDLLKSSQFCDNLGHPSKVAQILLNKILFEHKLT